MHTINIHKNDKIIDVSAVEIFLCGCLFAAKPQLLSQLRWLSKNSADWRLGKFNVNWSNVKSGLYLCNLRVSIVFGFNGDARLGSGLQNIFFQRKKSRRISIISNNIKSHCQLWMRKLENFVLWLFATCTT